MIHSMSAGPKPWGERDPVPWGDGDPDGGPIGQPTPYHDDPGESVSIPPASSPSNDFDDDDA